nr:MAG TPA: type I restriction-modification system methyltransferase [Caudoviricetes sp.]
MKGQLSLFDIELPPQKEAAIKEDASNKISFAKISEKPKPIFCKKDIPTVDHILKLLDKGTYKVNRYELLSDIFQCGAIAISNKFDITQAEEREKTYINIIKKYDKDMQYLIAEIFAKIYLLLTSQIDYGFADYIGELYMKSETSSKNAGQFFTPYCISKACAETAINSSQVEQYIKDDKILTLNEPACGSGGMIIATIDTLYNKYDFNYSRNLFVECSDIDARCVYMTYLQLACTGVPAVIYQQDTLTLQTWQRWETPAYIMQWLRFRDIETRGRT